MYDKDIIDIQKEIKDSFKNFFKDLNNVEIDFRDYDFEDIAIQANDDGYVRVDINLYDKGTNCDEIRYEIDTQIDSFSSDEFKLNLRSMKINKFDEEENDYLSISMEKFIKTEKR